VMLLHRLFFYSVSVNYMLVITVAENTNDSNGLSELIKFNTFSSLYNQNSNITMYRQTTKKTESLGNFCGIDNTTLYVKQGSYPSTPFLARHRTCGRIASF